MIGEQPQRHTLAHVRRRISDVRGWEEMVYTMTDDI